MSAGHTPGPWEMDCKTRPTEVCIVHGLPPHGDEGQKWAYIRGAIGYWEADENENLANARLIAAAPELLNELENCLDLLNLTFPDVPVDSRIGVAIAKARAAIDKATGVKG